MTATETTETEERPTRDRRGRFLPGNPGGPGGPVGGNTPKLDLVKIVRRKCDELDLDLEDLVADVFLAMLYKGACGDTKAAAIVFDRLGGVLERGPLVNFNLPGSTTPRLPPDERGEDGTPPLSEHLAKLMEIARERGLAFGEDLRPAQVVVEIAEAKAVEELLS